MRRRSLLPLAGLFTCVLLFAAWFELSLRWGYSDLSKLVLTDQNYGPYTPRQTFAGSIVIVNDTPYSGRILDAAASCGCTKLGIKERKIPAWGELPVDMEISPSYNEDDQKVHIVVSYELASVFVRRTVRQKFAITLSRQSPFHPIDPCIDLGIVRLDSRPENDARTIRLEWTGRKWSKVIPEAFTHDLGLEFSTQLDKHGVAISACIKNGASLYPGTYSVRVPFTFEDNAGGKVTEDVTVRAEIVGSVSYSPQLLVLHGSGPEMVTFSRSMIPGTSPITVSLGKKSAKLFRVEWQDGLSAIDSRQVTCAITALAKGVTEVEFVATENGRPQALKIPCVVIAVQNVTTTR